jgi:hypothetical protein
MGVPRPQSLTGKNLSFLSCAFLALLMHNLRAGGMAVATHGLEQTGLSVDIHVSYISTAKENDILTIEGETTKVGRNLAFTTVSILKGEDDNLILVATGSHTKYILRGNPRLEDKLKTFVSLCCIAIASNATT